MTSEEKIQDPNMRDCVVFGGRTHPDLVRRICQTLAIEPASIDTKNFSNGETSIKIHESVRDKDVFMVQTAYGSVNDALMELLIIVSALKIASAKSVTVVLPLFPYSRQLDATAAQKKAFKYAQRLQADGYTPRDADLNSEPPSVHRNSSGSSSLLNQPSLQPNHPATVQHGTMSASPRKAATFGEEVRYRPLTNAQQNRQSMVVSPSLRLVNTQDTSAAPAAVSASDPESQVDKSNKCWVSQNGSLIASLLATAGADHVITMDLHDPQFQGFFDVPFDNLLFRPLLLEYIQTVIPSYHSAVIVSPDAGGAQRATAVADQLHTRFALIHQDRRNNATILVGDVNDRVAILVDDLIDSGKTLLRAGKILKDHGAVRVYAICTHGLFSEDTVYKFRDSEIDQVVTTNSVPQDKNQKVLGDKLHVVDISVLFAEAIRRVYNGESISRLYSQAPMIL